jgi:hypothetical protein
LDISEKVSEFRTWSGNNYRIERKKPKEELKYNELKEAGIDSDNNGEITLFEYLKYMQIEYRELRIRKIDLDAAKNIDDLKNNKDRFVRVLAAGALGKPGDKMAAPALMEALQNISEKEDVRFASARALGKIAGEEAAEPALIGILMNNKEVPDTRSIAAEFLSKLGDRNSIAALIHTMKKDKDVNVRCAAASALIKTKDALQKGKGESFKKMIDEALKDFSKDGKTPVEALDPEL